MHYRFMIIFLFLSLHVHFTYAKESILSETSKKQIIEIIESENYYDILVERIHNETQFSELRDIRRYILQHISNTNAEIDILQDRLTKVKGDLIKYEKIKEAYEESIKSQENTLGIVSSNSSSFIEGNIFQDINKDFRGNDEIDLSVKDAMNKLEEIQRRGKLPMQSINEYNNEIVQAKASLGLAKLIKQDADIRTEINKGNEKITSIVRKVEKQEDTLVELSNELDKKTRVS
ncbi:hypothetical protein [Aeromonas caviae]|uniref:hypothetical protein n=1 Tax=Aeromonas caviae TaxID=648 RepID=UPI002B4742A4|nr:hypothetical protein [Aeromonas caviae]